MAEPTSPAVVVAGATSASGQAVTSALLEAGARVVAVGSDRGRMDRFAAHHPGVIAEVCDLTDAAAVIALAARVHGTLGSVDGLIHLVGGWRGSAGITGQSDDDWDFLERSLTALRLTSRVFYDDIAASTAGRIAMVSSVSVDDPEPGSASYSAVKAASEAWMRAIGRGFADAGASAASVIFVVRSLAGLESMLADRVVGLWQTDAAALNNARIPLRRT